MLRTAINKILRGNNADAPFRTPGQSYQELVWAAS